MDNKNREIDEKALLEKVEKAAMEGARKGSGSSLGKDLIKMIFGKVVVPTLLILAVMLLILPKFSMNNYKLKNLFKREEAVENQDLTLENYGFFGYTASDFAEVVLGDGSQLRKVQVLTYKVSDVATITSAGLGDLSIFSKTKSVTYNGTAVYTVDLSRLNVSSFEVDKENRKLTMKIPHAQLEPVNIQSKDIEFGETENGLLSFGELKLTPEQMAEIQTAAQEKMVSKLDKEDIAEQADRFAQMTVFEIYQPLVNKAAWGYTLEVVFND
ncbi:MAG: DUF4230 domain-containing protein [Firmicutes bacterium]|nr:DUF4230 domain-containing protein [Bacillota bacterium]